MNRTQIVAAAFATLSLAASLPAEAQPHRARARAPEAASAPQREYWSPSRQRDIYSAPPGYSGTVGASTPNEYGNLGGPTTGGGSSGGP